MTINIPTIVEGQGEVRALPILLRRLGELYFPECHIQIPAPHRLPRGKMMNRPDELKRAIRLAAAKGGSPSKAFIIILLDSDDDCPSELGRRLTTEAQCARPDFPISVSLAVREFESWIIASADSLGGTHHFPSEIKAPENPDTIRDAKGWIKQKSLRKNYSETIDQPRFVAQIDIEAARKGSRSFERFCKKFELMTAALVK